VSPALRSSTALPPTDAAGRRGRTAARTTAVALALALGLSGCGAGLRAQTYQQRTTSDSTNEAIGALAIRHIRVLPPRGREDYPVGSDATVALTVVNEGTEEDTLTSVTAEGAASVDVIGPGGRPAELVAPAQGTASQYAFVLRGLTRAVRPGNYISMELTFEKNGSQEMLVPIEVTGTPQPRREGYHVPETDSEGQVVEEEEPGEGGTEEGTGDRPELDNDGGDSGSGDQEPETSSDPVGDENGGADADTPPPEG
jgi:hypothetical protein